MKMFDNHFVDTFSLFVLCAAPGGSDAASSSKNLCVSGLSSSTRAIDLKTLFSKYGKVSPLPALVMIIFNMPINCTVTFHAL